MSQMPAGIEPSDPTAHIITIDGPASSGKSTLGKGLADYLGYLYFDTGVMYRAVTWVALERGVPVDDEAAITTLAQMLQIDVRPPSRNDGRAYDVLVNGGDVTWEIRGPQVEANVSAVSAYPGVRKTLTAAQRRIGLRGKVVMVGRDIGTVVLPEAGLKIYLDASVEERARRRCLELQGRSIQVDYAETLSALKARDQVDSTRQVAPLRPAPDAIILLSDNLNIDQVLDRAKELVKGRKV